MRTVLEMLVVMVLAFVAIGCCCDDCCGPDKECKEGVDASEDASNNKDAGEDTGGKDGADNDCGSKDCEVCEDGGCPDCETPECNTKDCGAEECGVCDEQCMDNSCSGHGQCNDADGSVRCDCNAGYSGERCENCVEIDLDLCDDAEGHEVYYADEDEDGYGNTNEAKCLCDLQGVHTVIVSGDCDDQDSDNWTSCETCVDEDEDSYFVGCDAYLTRSGPDCEDGDSRTYPGASGEHCDADRDCDGKLEPDLDRLLIGTLRSMASFIDPLTGLLHDKRSVISNGNAENPASGVLPQLSDVDLSAVTCSGNQEGTADMSFAAVRGATGATLDHAFELTYKHGSGVDFAYCVVPAWLDLSDPEITGLALRARSSHSEATLEVKLEDVSGCQIVWLINDLGTDYDWVSEDHPSPLSIPSGHGCDLARIEKLTFAAADTETGVSEGESVTWSIDHIAFTVSPDAIGNAAASMIDCESTAHPNGFLPLPCRGHQTNVDNVGYGLAVLGAAACLGLEVEVPGFDTLEEAILAGLKTLEEWPKFAGGDPCDAWLTTQGFPWTWFSPTNGLPTAAEPLVFALDEAHLAAALVVLEQAATSQDCSIDDTRRNEILTRSQLLRQGMNWSLLNNIDGEPVLAWCAYNADSACATTVVTQACQTAGLSPYLQSSRGDESLLRTFLAIADDDVDPSYWEQLRCEVANDGIDQWFWTGSNYPQSGFIGCEPTFRQQTPALFIDLAELPASRTHTGPQSPLDSLIGLMRAHDLALGGLVGYSDCWAPTGDSYYAACDIPPEVVTPQAALLGVEFLPDASDAICAFVQAGMDAPYILGGHSEERGMRDSINRNAISPIEGRGDAVYLPLDQARIALSLMNARHHLDSSDKPIVRSLFESDANVAQAYVALADMNGCPACGLAGEQIYRSKNLFDYETAAECYGEWLPESCTDQCGGSDVSIQVHPDYATVTANPMGKSISLNGIAFAKWYDSLPTGRPVAPCRYAYECEVKLPTTPFPDPSQVENPQTVHCMIQYFDPSDTDKESIEATVFWEVNAWAEPTGQLLLYTSEDRGGCRAARVEGLWLCPTGLTLAPDDQFHHFRIRADFESEQYTEVIIDGEITLDLTGWKLARVPRPTWTDKFLAVTTEIEPAGPGARCDYQYTAQFRNVDLRYW